MGSLYSNPNKGTTLDGRNPANQYSKYAICLHGFIHVSWCRISEPSTVWSTNPSKWPYICMVWSPLKYGPHCMTHCMTWKELEEEKDIIDSLRVLAKLAVVQWWTFVHPIVTASVGKTNKIPKPSAESSQRIPPDKFTERSEWTWDSGRVLPKENLGRFVFLGGILWPGLYGLPGRIPGPGKKTRISWRVRKKHHEIKVPWNGHFP